VGCGGMADIILVRLCVGRAGRWRCWTRWRLVKTSGSRLGCGQVGQDGGRVGETKRAAGRGEGKVMPCSASTTSDLTPDLTTDLTSEHQIANCEVQSAKCKVQSSKCNAMRRHATPRHAPLTVDSSPGLRRTKCTPNPLIPTGRSISACIPRARLVEPRRLPPSRVTHPNRSYMSRSYLRTD
jgi:hypothetical protein